MATLPAPGQEVWAQQLLDWIGGEHDMANFPVVGEYPWAQPLLDALLVEHNPDGTHVNVSILVTVDANGAPVLDANSETVGAGSGVIEHSEYDKALIHRTFHYEQSSDPGAVGAGLWWLNTTLTEIPTGSGLFGYRLSFRNDANDGWISL